jgi:hypothetical protein
LNTSDHYPLAAGVLEKHTCGTAAIGSATVTAFTKVGRAAALPSPATCNKAVCAGGASIVGGEEGLDAENKDGDFGGENDRARGSAVIVVWGWRIDGAEVAAANSSRDNTPSPFLSNAVKRSLVWEATYDAAGAVATIGAAVMEVIVGIAAGRVAELDTTIGAVGGVMVTGVARVERTVVRFGRERVRECIDEAAGGEGVGEMNCMGCCVAPSGTSCWNGCCT